MTRHTQDTGAQPEPTKVTPETLTDEELYAMKHAAWFEFKQACRALGLEPLPGGYAEISPIEKQRARVDCAYALTSFNARRGQP